MGWCEDRADGLNGAEGLILVGFHWEWKTRLRTRAWRGKLLEGLDVLDQGIGQGGWSLERAGQDLMNQARPQRGDVRPGTQVTLGRASWWMEKSTIS